MPPYDQLDEIRYRASQRRSQERRAAAGRTQRARRRGRAGLAAMAGSLLLASSAAVAANTGGAEAGTAPAAKSARIAALQVGSTGPAVRALQRRLRVAADGQFGPRTRAAVRRFQRRSGLRVTGVADAATLTALGLAATRAVARRAKPVTSRPATAAESRTLARIAACESGGNPAATGGGGRYRGKYQFSYATWETVGGVGDPAAAPEAEQDGRALLLLRRQGTQPWPNCA